MFIYIEDEILELENKSETLASDLKRILERLKENDRQIQAVIVDGTVLTVSLESYLADHLKDVKKVFILTDHVSRLVKETINTSQAYLQGATPLIGDLANGFYTSPDDQVWLSLVDLFEGLQWLIEAVTKMDQIKNLDAILLDYKSWNKYVQTVSGLDVIIQDLESAMASQDNVLIGDLLLYEIIPIFEKMQEVLVFLVSKEGDCHVS